MERAVRFIRNDTIRSLSVKVQKVVGPRGGISFVRSQPGQPPRLHTGELRRSISTEVVMEGSRLVGRVGTNKKYGKFLELGTKKMARRPFLTDALHRNRNVIARIMKGS